MRAHENEMFVATRGAVKDWKCIVGGLIPNLCGQAIPMYMLRLIHLPPLIGCLTVVTSSCQPIRVSSETRGFLTDIPDKWVYVYSDETVGDADTVTIVRMPDKSGDLNFNERSYRCRSRKWNTDLVAITLGNEISFYWNTQSHSPLLTLYFPLGEHKKKYASVEDGASVRTSAGSFDACTKISVRHMHPKDFGLTSFWIDQQIGIIRVVWDKVEPYTYTSTIMTWNLISYSHADSTL